MIVLLLHEAPLPVQEGLHLLTQLEHVHMSSRKTRRGLPQVQDTFVEDSVLDKDGLNSFLKVNYLSIYYKRDSKKNDKGINNR